MQRQPRLRPRLAETGPVGADVQRAFGNGAERQVIVGGDKAEIFPAVAQIRQRRLAGQMRRVEGAGQSPFYGRHARRIRAIGLGDGRQPRRVNGEIEGDLGGAQIHVALELRREQRRDEIEPVEPQDLRLVRPARGQIGAAHRFRLEPIEAQAVRQAGDVEAHALGADGEARIQPSRLDVDRLRGDALDRQRPLGGEVLDQADDRAIEADPLKRDPRQQIGQLGARVEQNRQIERAVRLRVGAGNRQIQIGGAKRALLDPDHAALVLLRAKGQRRPGLERGDDSRVQRLARRDLEGAGHAERRRVRQRRLAGGLEDAIGGGRDLGAPVRQRAVGVDRQTAGAVLRQPRERGDEPARLLLRRKVQAQGFGVEITQIAQRDLAGDRVGSGDGQAQRLLGALIPRPPCRIEGDRGGREHPFGDEDVLERQLLDQQRDGRARPIERIAVALRESRILLELEIDAGGFGRTQHAHPGRGEAVDLELTAQQRGGVPAHREPFRREPDAAPVRDLDADQIRHPVGRLLDPFGGDDEFVRRADLLQGELDQRVLQIEKRGLGGRQRGPAGGDGDNQRLAHKLAHQKACPSEM